MTSTLAQLAAVRAGNGRTQRRKPWWRTEAIQGWTYAAPTALFVGVFFLAPLGLLAWMSFHKWPLVGNHSSLNLPDNYTGVAKNDLFAESVKFTLKYTVIVTVALIALALFLALLVQTSRRGVAFFRTAFFIPSAVGLASASLLFIGLYNPSFGPLSSLLQKMGLIDEPVSWLGTPNMALISTLVLILWKFAGFYMLIFMVGLQGISPDVYEAARIDGASARQQFFRITLPLLRSTVALALILCITGSLLAFDQFFILTRGGPDNTTVTIVMVIYREAFTRFNLGSAAALSMMVLIALVVLNAVQFRGLRSREG